MGDQEIRLYKTSRLNKNVINQRLSNQNITLIGEYINTTTHTTFRCFCGNEFKARPSDLLNGKSRSCGDIHKHRQNNFYQLICSKQLSTTDKYCGTAKKYTLLCTKCNKKHSLTPQQIQKHKCIRCRNLKLFTVGQTVKNNKIINLDNKKIQCKCTDCNGVYCVRIARLIKRYPHPCKYIGASKLNIIIEDYCNKHGLIKINTFTTINNRVEIKCNCNRHFSYIARNLFRRIKTNKVVCCKICYFMQLLKSKIKNGQQYGQLTILNVNDLMIKNKKLYVKCKCSCGTEKYLNYSTIKGGSIKSCGNCHLFVKGVMTSYNALMLHKTITEFGVHNFKSKHAGCIDIAFIYMGKKIAIEYDEWFWHKNNKRQDMIKTKNLIKNGWTVIRILAHNDIPPRKIIFHTLDYIISNKIKYKLLKSKNWGGYNELL